ncbi:SPFH domain-containing protein [Nocardioides sp. Iso805N]|uniref:SPFH domain-containing protein n=1 Tax=Nocardioides sp. Iso805N TaxID=1283287 RepID=UPI0003735AC2|nr:SPFH domain-containing protein [Nocardioides sp. Iso805N]
MGILILLVVLAVAGYLVWERTRGQAKRSGGRPAAPLRTGRVIGIGLAAIVVLAVVWVVADCVTTVGTKDVGVVTSFGKPTGRDLSNGVHLKAPWQKVTEMDAAIQPDEFAGNSCIQVRIGDSSTACADLTIRWHIAPDEASTLFQNYRSNDVNQTIRDSLVVTQLKGAVNDVLGTFNPLANVNTAANSSQDNTQISAAPNLDKFSQQIEDQMNQRLASMNHGTSQILIDSVTLSFLRLADSTQAKINAYQAEVGNTRIAEQRQKTATAEAAANQALAASVSHDPNVLVSKCLDTLEEIVKAGQTIPAGFSCWPGSGSNLVLGTSASGSADKSSSSTK